MDFYKIDGSLFSPAIVIINSLDSGKTFKGGHVNEELIKSLFLMHTIGIISDIHDWHSDQIELNLKKKLQSFTN